VYDAYRDIIPTNAELNVVLGSYTWTYDTIGSPTKNPLIIFPRYKTLSPANPVRAGFLVNEPLKGILYGTEAINKQAAFVEAPLPTFLNTQFLPEDFWKRLNNFDVILAKSYLDLYFDDPANLTEIVNNVYNNGKLLYKAASSVRYATQLMKYLKLSDAAIIAKTQPFVDAIKQALEAWLFNLQTAARTGVFPDPTKYFFIGDSTVGGICATINGMLAGSNAAQASDIFGNAEYNDHHFQYGYWLGAAAAVIDWDNQYGTAPPWIAQTHLSGSGLGPFKMKSFVDVLWRDTVNPDPQDPDLPYHRHGNPWEGHSTANGLILPDPYAAGRNQESLAEDFNCWLGTLFYARAVLETNAAFPGALTATDLQGFTGLVDFCSTFLSMTATSGNLYYNTPNWPYANIGFNFNATVGNQFDGLVDSATFFGRGDDPCSVCN
jgi:endoglucanase Acf2